MKKFTCDACRKEYVPAGCGVMDNYAFHETAIFTGKELVHTPVGKAEPPPGVRINITIGTYCGKDLCAECLVNLQSAAIKLLKEDLYKKTKDADDGK